MRHQLSKRPPPVANPFADSPSASSSLPAMPGLKARVASAHASAHVSAHASAHAPAMVHVQSTSTTATPTATSPSSNANTTYAYPPLPPRPQHRSPFMLSLTTLFTRRPRLSKNTIPGSTPQSRPKPPFSTAVNGSPAASKVRMQQYAAARIPPEDGYRPNPVSHDIDPLDGKTRACDRGRTFESFVGAQFLGQEREEEREGEREKEREGRKVEGRRRRRMVFRRVRRVLRRR